MANGYGEDHSQAILSEIDVMSIKMELLSFSKTQYEIASEFGIVESEISMINNGRRWGFLGDFSYPIRKQGGMRAGEKNPASILSDEQVLSIRKRYEKETGRAIYKDYEQLLSYPAFERALTGRTYKHIPIFRKKTKEWINPVSTIPS